MIKPQYSLLLVTFEYNLVNNIFFSFEYLDVKDNITI